MLIAPLAAAAAAAVPDSVAAADTAAAAVPDSVAAFAAGGLGGAADCIVSSWAAGAAAFATVTVRMMMMQAPRRDVPPCLEHAGSTRGLAPKWLWTTPHMPYGLFGTPTRTQPLTSEEPACLTSVGEGLRRLKDSARPEISKF